MPGVNGHVNGLNGHKHHNNEEKEEERSQSPSVDPVVPIKHPLQHSWTLWYFKNDKTKSWEENQRKVISFHFVEDFWALYNHIESPSRLNAGCDYSLFKVGIKPMWEDEANRHGGRWLISQDKKERTTGTLDRYWLELMMCLIGEAFGDQSNIINGAVIGIRPKLDKIGLWLRDVKPAEDVMQVGRTVKQRLQMTAPLCFESHQDTMYKSGSKSRSKFVI